MAEIRSVSMSSNGGFKYYRAFCLLLVAALLVMIALIKPVNVPFWQFTVSDILNLLIALLLTSLFIERATEVIIVTWRNRGKQAFVNEVMSFLSAVEKYRRRVKEDLVK